MLDIHKFGQGSFFFFGFLTLGLVLFDYRVLSDCLNAIRCFDLIAGFFNRLGTFDYLFNSFDCLFGNLGALDYFFGRLFSHDYLNVVYFYVLGRYGFLFSCHNCPSLKNLY